MKGIVDFIYENASKNITINIANEVKRLYNEDILSDSDLQVMDGLSIYLYKGDTPNSTESVSIKKTVMTSGWGGSDRFVAKTNKQMLHYIDENVNRWYKKANKIGLMFRMPSKQPSSKILKFLDNFNCDAQAYPDNVKAVFSDLDDFYNCLNSLNNLR